MDRSRWQTILGACAEAVAVLDGDGTIVLASAALQRELGHDDLVGRSLTDVLHPDDFADFTGILVGFVGEVGVTAWSTWRMLRADGAWLEAEATATNLLSCPGVQGIVISFRDVTERNATFQTLQASRQRLEAMLDIAGAAIFVTDLEGRCVLANRHCAQLVERRPEEMVGMRAEDLLRAEDAERFVEHARAVMVAGRAMQFDESIEIGGETRQLLSAIAPIVDSDGNATGVCAVLTDITERVRAQTEREHLRVALQRAQRMDALGQLAGGVAHDFNNLLVVILNYANFVAETLGEEHEVAPDVAEIARATERAASLTRQLLVFSRHDHLKLEPVDINEVALGMQRLLERTLGGDVSLTVHVADRPVHALADAGQLEQVLMNLVLNARDAMPRGGSVGVLIDEVTLTAADADRRGVRPGPHVRIEVADDGDGMPPDVAERAFEPFFTTKPKERGTGLGLSTVYGIVTGAEGHIEIDSRLQEGTIITMHLPIVGAGTHASESPVTEPDAQPAATVVVVVEDEDAIRALTKRILTRQGYEVVDSPSPLAAVELYDGLERRPSLLLTDVVMPGMSGKDLADRLRERDPELRVLYMSGYTDNVMDRYGLDASGDALLHKPFNAQQLLSAVQDALG